MGLTRTAQRAYLEALARTQRGCASPRWRGNEQDVEVWMDAFRISGLEDISPWDALLLAVRRRAERAHWVDTVIEEIIRQDRIFAIAEGKPEPTVPPESVRAWMAESRKEEQLMARSAKLAIDAGVADAMVRRMQREGRIVTDALVAGLDALDLTQDQRFHALTKMHQVLTAGPQGDPSLPGLTGPPRVVDADTDDDEGDDE